MAMSVELGALEKVVQDLIDSGRYGSKSEVLRTGVRLVEEREARLAELHAKLQEGIDAADRGDLYDVEDSFAALRARYSEPDR